MAVRKKRYILILPILTLLAVIICVGINLLVNPTEEHKKVEIFTPKGEVTEGYSDFEEYSKDITAPDTDGMPNYIDADNIQIANQSDTQAFYCGNKNSGVFHKLSCSALSQTKEENKIYFTSLEECRKTGYTACSRCKP